MPLTELNIISTAPIICGFIIIVTGYSKLWKLRKTLFPEAVGIFGIWLIGIIALLLGVLGQIYSLRAAFDAIAMAGDISASIVADNLKDSYKHTISGLIVLIISLIVWGILKGLKSRKIVMKKLKEQS